MTQEQIITTTLSPNVLETDAGLIDFGLIDYLGKIPGLAHHLKERSLIDNTFTLANFSKWIASNIVMVDQWKNEDELFITQNQAFFSTYRFAIVNPRLQKAVPASLLLEPLPVEQRMFFITKIDLANDVVTLSNGNEYSVHPNDHGTLRKFSANDRAMFGFNSSDKVHLIGADSFKFYILIDTTCNAYVRVNVIY